MQDLHELGAERLLKSPAEPRLGYQQIRSITRVLSSDDSRTAPHRRGGGPSLLLHTVWTPFRPPVVSCARPVLRCLVTRSSGGRIEADRPRPDPLLSTSVAESQEVDARTPRLPTGLRALWALLPATSTTFGWRPMKPSRSRQPAARGPAGQLIECAKGTQVAVTDSESMTGGLTTFVTRWRCAAIVKRRGMQRPITQDTPGATASRRHELQTPSGMIPGSRSMGPGPWMHSIRGCRQFGPCSIVRILWNVLHRNRGVIPRPWSVEIVGSWRGILRRVVSFPLPDCPEFR